MTANIVGHVRSRPHGGRVSGARACAVLLLLASGVIGCSGGEENAPPTTVAEVGPVFLDPNEPATWEVRHRFVFRNPSPRHPAILEVADKSCGCAECAVDPRVVPPGETAPVVLRMGLDGVVQRREEAVTLRTHLPELPEVHYILVAWVYPRLQTQPHGDITLEVPAGNYSKVPVAVEAYQPAAEKMDSFRLRALGSGLQIEPSGPPATTVAHGVRRIRMECQVCAMCPDFTDPAFGKGAFSGMIEVGYGRWQLRRNVFWRAEGAVRVWPSALFLAPQNPQAASAVLHCDAPGPFALGSVSASSPALHCLAPTGVKARHHTVTACWRGARGGAPLEEHRITVRLEGLRQPVLQIPVYVLW